jgi:hypothetical protein
MTKMLDITLNMNVISNGRLDRFFAVKWNNVNNAATTKITMNVLMFMKLLRGTFFPNLFSAKLASPSNNRPLKNDVSMIGIIKAHPINVRILLPARTGVDVASNVRMDWNELLAVAEAKPTATELIIKKTAPAIATSGNELHLFCDVFSRLKEIFGSNLYQMKSPIMMRI